MDAGDFELPDDNSSASSLREAFEVVKLSAGPGIESWVLTVGGDEESSFKAGGEDISMGVGSLLGVVSRVVPGVLARRGVAGATLSGSIPSNSGEAAATVTSGVVA